MNKDDFIKTLKTDNISKELKLECCQFFIDNYPVMLKQIVNPFTGQFIENWTKLDIKFEGGSDKSINFAFEQLVKRVKELEDYEKK
jgi:hypothetical protein